MPYAVKEIFYTLQGEGVQAGRPAVFCRFAGCNLWSGREKDRATAICQFCDTDFVGTDGLGGGSFDTAETLVSAIESFWPSSSTDNRFVVCTGGEPLLQLDKHLVDALHSKGFEIAIETNGTLLPPNGIDWICVSPKANAPLKLTKADELKIVIPQDGLNPKDFESMDFRHLRVQPMDNHNRNANTQQAIEFCMNNPKWLLSLQTHKMTGIR